MKSLGRVYLVDDDELMILTENGTSIRLPVGSVRVISRNTKGVTLINLTENDKITSIARISEKEEEKVGEGADLVDENGAEEIEDRGNQTKEEEET